jgi:RNA polymerase sigma-70 factor (ECF subfamily)
MTTNWDLIRQAHDGTAEQAATARAALLDRYSPAVYTYLLGLLRDPHAAEDLRQEFAWRFLKGYFRRARPDRGRFRSMLIRSLHNLAKQHWLRVRKGRQSISTELVQAHTAFTEEKGPELTVRRTELIGRAWAALARREAETGRPFHTVLWVRSSHPDVPLTQLTEVVTKYLGRPMTYAGLRKALERARLSFVSVLIQELAASLTDPTPEQIERELIDLKLLQFCKTKAERINTL